MQQLHTSLKLPIAKQLKALYNVDGKQCLSDIASLLCILMQYSIVSLF